MALTQWARYLDKLKAGRRQSKVIALRANDAPYVNGAV
jgi:hypothetical protein